MVASSQIEGVSSNVKWQNFRAEHRVNSATYARYVGRVGALAVALGVGVAVATGGTGFAWANPGSAGDSPSSGASSSDGADSSSGQAAGGDSAATQTESGSVDDAIDGDDAGLDSDADDAEQSTDTTVPPDDDEYEDYDEPDGLDDPEIDDGTDVDIDDQDRTAATVEPESMVTQRDSALQGSPSDDVDQASERIDDMASVAEPVDAPHAFELTEQQQPAESSTSRVSAEILVDEPVQVATILVEDEPTPTATETSSDVVGIASTVMAALLSPFVAPGPGAPAEPPLAWALLGWVRREWQHMLLNRTPTPVVDDITTSEDTPITVDVVTGTDPDAVAGDVVTLTEVTQPQNGTVTYEGGTLTYTPNADFHGTDTFTYTISDEESPLHVHGLRGLWAVLFGGDAGHASTVTVTVTVNPVNDVPEAVDDFVTVAEDSGATVIDVLDNDTDLDGDDLSVIAVGSAANGTATLTDGVITYTPNADFYGTDSFSYTISDGMGGTATATVTVTVTAEQDPPAPADDMYTTDEDTPLNIPAPGVLGNDVDVDGDDLSVQLAQQPLHGTVSLNEDGSFTYTPTSDFHGVDSFVYTVTDGNGGTATATVYVTVNPVNDAPVAVDDAVTVDEDSGASVIDVLGNDTDVDGDALSVTTVSSAGNGTVTLIDGVITYTPDTDFHGTDSFTYTVSDGNGGTATATVYVTVNPVNDAPVAGDDSASTDQDTPVVIDVLGNDYDVDAGDRLALLLTQQPQYGQASLNDDGTITYTPNPGFHGTDTFSYQLDDGTDTSNIATVTITVHQAPLVANDDYVVTDEDTSVLIDVLANDSDPTGDTITGITIEYDGDGAIDLRDPERFTFTYIPRPDFFGTDTITYYLRDADGRISNVATVTITVNPVNDDPVAADDLVTVDEDSGATVIDVLGNDTDVEDDELTVTGVGTASNGTVMWTDGVITYTPDADFHGADSFTYTISDGNGGTATATVHVTVNPVNDEPVASDDIVTVRTNSGPTAVDVLGNDSDVDGDNLSVTDVGTANNGTVTLSDGVITYTPDTGFVGSDSFTYTVNDGNGGVATATVHVTVNNPPVANDDEAFTEVGVPIVINVLENDFYPSGEDRLSVRIIHEPHRGTAEVNEDGTITYTPEDGFRGPDHFWYEISDGTGARASAFVDIRVDARTLVADDVAVDTGEDTSVQVDIRVRDNLPGGDTDVTIRVDNPGNGVVRFVEHDQGVFRLAYTPQPHFIGTDSFTYQLVGADGRVSDRYTVTITVDPATGGPRALDDTVVVDPNSDAVEIDVLANDFEVHDQELRVVQVGEARNGTVTVTDGVVTYRPNAGFDGVDSFTYTVANDVGEAATAIVAVTVKDANPITFDDEAVPSESFVTDTGNRIYVLTDEKLRIFHRVAGLWEVVELGKSPASVTVSRYGDRAYVGTSDGADVTAIAEVDLRTGTSKPLGEVAQPTAMALDRYGETLYVADYQDATVAVINTVTGEQQVLDIGLRSNSIAVSEFRETLYVGSINNEVWAVDTETGSKELVYSGAWDESTVADPSITVAGEFLYVADGLNNRVAVINAFTNETYAVYDVWASPTSVAATRYGDVLVSSRAENKVTVISLELGVLGTFEVGGDLIDIDIADVQQQEVYITTREGISTIPMEDLGGLFWMDQM
ncbi:Ig-like domain-containing protein [Mycolicibacterium pulveris]